MTFTNVTRYWKAVVAGVGFLATLVHALATNPDINGVLADDTITNDEWVRLAIAAATALAVYGVPNQRPTGEPHNPRMSEQD